MGFRINTNVSSIAAQRSLNVSNRNTQSTLAKMSSGTRITRASDDAAGLAISEKLKANRNANDGISMVFPWFKLQKVVWMKSLTCSQG